MDTLLLISVDLSLTQLLHYPALDKTVLVWHPRSGEKLTYIFKIIRQMFIG